MRNPTILKAAVAAIASSAILSFSAQAQEKIYPEWEGSKDISAPYIVKENGQTSIVFTNTNPGKVDVDVKMPSDLFAACKADKAFALDGYKGEYCGKVEDDGIIWFRIPEDKTGGKGTQYRFSLMDRKSIPMDTTVISYPDYKMKVHLRHDYTKTLVTKLYLSSSFFDGKYKHADNGKQEVCINFEQALDRIKALDNITLGMPKIAYLVGWQYNGHDSKYPAFFEGNEALKRPGDANALESIKWLMGEGPKYNTAVSLHINMFDCYEDSPLFEEYLRNDILARHKSGFLRNSDWGYKVDYVQEWNSGYAKARIDSLCSLLPVQKAGSIHIDAFHTNVPDPIEQADGTYKFHWDTLISPYHGWTRKQEIAAQIEIFKYWDSKGIDVTTEGLDTSVDGDNDPHCGYRPMVWHLSHLTYTKYPASILTGGDNGEELTKKVFGSNDDLEQLLKCTDPDYKEVIRRVCTSSFVANYLNRFDRKVYIHNAIQGKVQFSDGLETEAVIGGMYTVKKNGITLVDGEDELIPALWVGDNALVAYSHDGYKTRTWTLLPEYPAKGKATIWSVDENGKKLLKKTSYSAGKLKLSVAPGQMLLVELEK